MKLFLSVVCGIALAVSGAVGQGVRSSSQPGPAERPVNMLVLGDSVLWGEGLKTEHKAWYHVKLWIEKAMGRPVVEKIEAHSGAVVEARAADEMLTATDGEVDVALPSVLNQVDRALQHYGDGAKVDLVLVTGCVNDIGAPNLLDADSSAEIVQLTEAKCGRPMERLLQKITTSFPSADVIVTGYYLFFSEKTRNDFVLRALARKFQKSHPAVHNQGGHTRVMFTNINFAPEYSFGTKETRLWGFDRSPFRTMLLFLSLGKILLPTNDEVRRQRSASCRVAFKRQQNESSEQKKERQNRLLLCRYAALGHPNKKGAVLYSDAIINLLKTTPGSFSSSH